MRGKVMPYLLVAAGALAVGLVVAGTPVASLLPFVLLLACPLIMVFMMRGMGHGQGQAHQGGNESRENDHDWLADRTKSTSDAALRG